MKIRFFSKKTFFRLFWNCTCAECVSERSSFRTVVSQMVLREAPGGHVHTVPLLQTRHAPQLRTCRSLQRHLCLQPVADSQTQNPFARAQLPVRSRTPSQAATEAQLILQLPLLVTNPTVVLLQDTGQQLVSS